MSPWRKATVVIVLAVTAGLIGWDVLAISQAGTASSISDVITQASHAYLAIPFGAGFLCGHLFFSQRGTP